jgi:hypothetical protein
MASSLQPLSQAVTQGILVAFEKIRNSFERNPIFLNNLTFHNTIHTQEVIAVSERLLVLLYREGYSKIGEREILLAKLAAAFHDIIQDWKSLKVLDRGIEKEIRIRYEPGVIENEVKSADEAELFMRLYNRNQQLEIFSENDIELVRECIEATLAVYDLKRKTYNRPNITSTTSPVARIVAFADLHKTLLDPAGSFNDGDKFFHETNIDMELAFHKKITLDEVHKKFFKRRVVEWAENQASFVTGRAEEIVRELEGAPDELKSIIFSSFTKKDESIAYADQKATLRQGMSFEECLRDAGYPI